MLRFLFAIGAICNLITAALFAIIVGAILLGQPVTISVGSVEVSWNDSDMQPIATSMRRQELSRQ